MSTAASGWSPRTLAAGLNLAPVGLKWVAFREAREAVLKIGQEALKSE